MIPRPNFDHPKTIRFVVGACVAFYLATLFLRTAHVMQMAFLLIAFVIWVRTVPKAFFLRLAHHWIFVTWLLLVAFAALSLSWTPDFSVSFKVYKRYFLDQIFLVPMLVWLLMQPGYASRLNKVVAFCGLVAVSLNAAQYAYELSVGTYHWLKHREWGYPLVFFLPFLMAQATAVAGRQRLFWAAIAVSALLMILACGARGAWLGAVAVGMVYAIYLFGARWFLVSAGAVSVLLATLVICGNNIVAERLAQGADTSGRIQRAWLPSVELVLDKPVLGYGLGKEIYREEMDKRALVRPELKTVLNVATPHNFFLLAFFELGLVGVSLLLALLAGLVNVLVVTLAREGPQEQKLFALATLAALLGHYFVRGMFESLDWQAVGVFTGFCLGLLALRKLPSSRIGGLMPSPA